MGVGGEGRGFLMVCFVLELRIGFFEEVGWYGVGSGYFDVVCGSC